MGYRLDPVEFAKKLLSDNPRHMTDTVLQYLLVEKQQRSVAQGHHFSSTGHAASTTGASSINFMHACMKKRGGGQPLGRKRVRVVCFDFRHEVAHRTLTSSTAGLVYQCCK